METPTLEQIIDVLDNAALYTLFFTGEGQYEGSFRVDRATGSEVKHSHYLFETYHQAEIYPNDMSGDSEQQKAGETVIVHRIEHALKESYHRVAGERGMKDRKFVVTRVTDDGRYLGGELDGEVLSRDLKELLRTSRTLTVIERGSSAERLYRETLGGSGRVKLHPGDVHLSEMSAEEKERYDLQEIEDEDPAGDVTENVLEHHPE